jgi:hypothetical protein
MGFAQTFCSFLKMEIPQNIEGPSLPEKIVWEVGVRKSQGHFAKPCLTI